MNKKVSLFLDSGAYSAWAKGVKVVLQDYINFIKENEKYIEVYANLDDLTSPEKTWENQKEMERQGLHPLPVYHSGEPMKYLYKAMEYEYFGLGGVALAEAKTRSKLYDLVFGIICPKENKYFPKNKIHGFGMTALEFIIKYPFYSVDSTSWVLTSRFGSVYVPKLRDGKYNYSLDPWKVVVSNRSPSQSDAWRHISTFTPYERTKIKEYFSLKGFVLGESKIRKVDKDYKLKSGERWLGEEEANSQRNVTGQRTGFVPIGWTKDYKVEVVVERGLSNDYRFRDQLNIMYFLDLEKAIPVWPWPFKQESPGMESFGFRG